MLHIENHDVNNVFQEEIWTGEGDAAEHLVGYVQSVTVEDLEKHASFIFPKRENI